MFRMQAIVKIGNFPTLVKPNAVEYKRSVDDFSAAAVVKLPGLARLRGSNNEYKIVNAAEQFAEGMTMQVYSGYNDNLPLRFKGFIRRINFTVPVELECEGYSYQLRKKEGYTRSYASTTVRQLLAELVTGTDIKLSEAIPDIPLKNVWFKNVKGTDVLEYLKTKCLLTVFFENEILYCGLRMTEPSATKNLRLGWNVIKDTDLKFDTGKELATVNIRVEKTQADGTKAKATVGAENGEVKVLKISNISDPVLLKQIAAQKRKELQYRGYEGSVTLFALPVITPGMAVEIYDKRYPQRTGKYFVEAVEGSMSVSGGGRQKIKIGASL